jgi:hypothetical protein
VRHDLDADVVRAARLNTDELDRPLTEISPWLDAVFARQIHPGLSG